MEVLDDARTIWKMITPRAAGVTHQERLESFYRPQATDYDRFRRKLLPGREELIQSLPWDQLKDRHWLDVGCGTGSNIELAHAYLPPSTQVHLLDLAPSLLDKARERVQRLGLDSQTNLLLMDATQLCTLGIAPHLITCSFSLTMIPNWFAVLESIRETLAPGGVLAVVDFYTSRKFPDNHLMQHGWITRNFWRAWFEIDSVYPSADHLPYLRQHFETIDLYEGTHPLPWVPFLRAPFYRFVGRKRLSSSL
jgi:S-adenosylmethionine-diacylgycerolhomoserine-N-methlytransferase